MTTPEPSKLTDSTLVNPPSDLNNVDDDDTGGAIGASLQELADEFVANVQVKDRTYHLKTYKQVFIGKQAVDWLVSSGRASTRADAVQLGQSLQSYLQLFEHVTRDHAFADEHYFYTFTSPTQRGGLSVSPTTGESIRWQDFLDPVSAGAIPTAADIVRQPSFEKVEPHLSEHDQHVIQSVWPHDEYNKTLLDNVHPPAWQDPSSSNEEYDVVVIGGGTGGLISAAGSAGVGAKVALIEAHMLGGDCLNVGCVPSKALIHSANLAATLKNDEYLARAGISLPGGPPKVDFDKVMERVRKVRSDISHHDSAVRYSQELGVEIFLGYAKFDGPRTVVVNDKRLNFKRCVIATGAYPTLIAMDGLEDLYKQANGYENSREEQQEIDKAQPRPIVMTNETVFNLTQQPQHLVVIGSGVIGMELAQAMQRLGSQVTVTGRSGKVLPKEDADMAALVHDQLVKDGVTFRLNVKEYVKIELTGRVVADNGYPEMRMTIKEKDSNAEKVIEFDALLVAAGRAPNVTGLNLEAAKVEYDFKAGLIVNDKLQSATNARVYGVGDVCSKFKFTHAADFMARAVIRNALFFGKEKMSNLLIPYATFTSPEIASVGLYESDLKKQGTAYRIIEKHFETNDRAICDDDTTGFVRFRVDAKTDKILGASIVGTGAGNMISEVTLAMQSDTGLGSLAAVIHPYPTTAEVLRQAGDVYSKTRLTPTVKSILRTVVKLQR